LRRRRDYRRRLRLCVFDSPKSELKISKRSGVVFNADIAFLIVKELFRAVQFDLRKHDGFRKDVFNFDFVLGVHGFVLSGLWLRLFSRCEQARFQIQGFLFAMSKAFGSVVVTASFSFRNSSVKPATVE
jgi:hypothetical protein